MSACHARSRTRARASVDSARKASRRAPSTRSAASSSSAQNARCRSTSASMRASSDSPGGAAAIACNSLVTPDRADTTTSTRTPSSRARSAARRPMVSQRWRRDTDVPPNFRTTQRSPGTADSRFAKRAAILSKFHAPNRAARAGGCRTRNNAGPRRPPPCPWIPDAPAPLPASRCVRRPSRRRQSPRGGAGRRRPGRRDDAGDRALDAAAGNDVPAPAAGAGHQLSAADLQPAARSPASSRRPGRRRPAPPRGDCRRRDGRRTHRLAGSGAGASGIQGQGGGLRGPALLRVLHPPARAARFGAWNLLRIAALFANRESAVPGDRWVVLKFGVTSVSRRHRWDTIGRLAAERAREEGVRVLVVVSALSGVTNELQAIAAAPPGESLDARIDALVERHRAFCAELELAADRVLGARLDALRALSVDARANARDLAWQADILAQGELLSSTLGAAYLQATGLPFGWCDAREWLDGVSLPNASRWAQRLSVNCRCAPDAALQARFAAQPAPMLVTQGFIARHADGGTAILGRGGSDTSAAYFGALLEARRVEIWTDVPGMFSANPRDVPDARLLTRLDYAEAQEIATTGAKVLHPRSIAPCRDANVPMAILDTERPDLPGTRIDASAATVPGVKAISRRNGIVLVSMESIGMWQQVGFLADVFERFKRNGLSVDLIGSSETNVTVSLDPSENLVTTNVLEALSADLAEVCRVKVIAPCAAITLVGRGMRSLLHKLSDVWAAFGQERVHLISQSSNDLNLTFVIDEADADGMLPQVHAELIRGGAMPVQETSVFGPSWREIAHGKPVRRTPWWVDKRDTLLARAQAGAT